MGWSAPTRDIQPWHSQYLLLWGPVLVHNFVFRPRHTLQSNISGTLEAMTKMLCSETLQLGWSGRAHKFAHIHICICIRHPFPYYLSIPNSIHRELFSVQGKESDGVPLSKTRMLSQPFVLVQAQVWSCAMVLVFMAMRCRSVSLEKWGHAAL